MRSVGKWLGRILLVLVAAVIALLYFGPGYVERSRNSVIEHDPYPVSPEARALHDTLIVGDWHADSLLWNRDLLARGSYGQVDIPRLLEGGVAIQAFTVVTKSPSGQNYDSIF